MDGLVLAGTTAEAVLLSPTERQDLVRVARKAALDLGLSNYPLMAGISGQSTNESIRLAEEAQQAGADFGLLLPPSYWAKAVNKNVILDFYHEVADHSGIPIVVYSEYTMSQFSVHAGSSDWLLPCLIGGGAGCVTGIGNVFPKSVARLYALWKEGKIEQARELQGLVAQAEKACKEGIAPTKFAAAHFVGSKLGITDSQAFWPRKPYKPSGKEMQEWVVSVMKHLAEIEDSLPEKHVI
ncbi:hypothetical protein ATERTT37_006864 [Aspergillus terreus]